MKSGNTSSSNDETSEYNLSDDGSSPMILPFGPPRFSTQNHQFVDYQYRVDSSVYDSSWCRGSDNNGGGRIVMDELGLSSEFRKLDVGNRLANDVVPSDYGQFGRNSDGFSVGDGNVARIRPSSIENFGGLGLVNGFSSSNVNVGEGRFSYSSPVYNDERRYRSTGQKLSTFDNSGGTNCHYIGEVGSQNCLNNYRLGDTAHQAGEYYGNGAPIARGSNCRLGETAHQAGEYYGNGAPIARGNNYRLSDTAHQAGEYYGNGAPIARGSNYRLGDTAHQAGEYYGNGAPIARRNNWMYGDRVSMSDSEGIGYGDKVSRVNDFGNGNLIQGEIGGYGTENPNQSRAMYDFRVVDDSLQHYVMANCKGMLDPWASCHNYEALLQHSLGSSQLLDSKEALSRGTALYNTMRENTRGVSLLKKMRHPHTGDGGGVNGSTGRSNQSDGRRKSLLSGNLVQKLGEMSLDLNGSLHQGRIGGLGSPATNSSDSLVPQTMYSSLADVQGNIYLMAKDQHGCRYLQQKFEDGSFEDVQAIFNEIADHVVELMINPFGNYLIQKLLDVCNEDQRMKIVHVVTKNRGDLVRICLNTHGTRVVQKLIDGLRTRKQISLIIRSLEPGFLDLIKDLNGNHVVQRCLQCLNSDDNKFIFDAAAKFCVDIATHRHGCCVLQRCIAHSNGDHRKKLIEEICRNSLILAQDPFGNYVVQYILELKTQSATAQLMTRFQGNFVHLSMQKFSSHVVEKCLKVVEESHALIVNELISVPNFEQLLQDPFANYVVQSCLEATKGVLHESLVAAVRPHSILRTNPYCKKIFTRGLIRK